MSARWIPTAICVGLATLVAFPVAQADHDDDDDDGGELVGTWRVTAPNDESFFAHLVFNEGNTLTERNTVSTRFTSSSGVWKKIRGRGNYATTLELFGDLDMDGSFDTRILVRQTVHVEGDDLLGRGTIEFRSLDGEDLVGEPMSGTFTATRMRVIRE